MHWVGLFILENISIFFFDVFLRHLYADAIEQKCKGTPPFLPSYVLKTNYKQSNIIL